jgi:hypothetical protein
LPSFKRSDARFKRIEPLVHHRCGAEQDRHVGFEIGEHFLNDVGPVKDLAEVGTSFLTKLARLSHDDVQPVQDLGEIGPSFLTKLLRLGAHDAQQLKSVVGRHRASVARLRTIEELGAAADS